MVEKKKKSSAKPDASNKRKVKAVEGIERTKFYVIDDAVKLVKERALAKFDETIDVVMNLGVDPRHSDQMVRGVVAMPNGIGKTIRVAVFAKGAKVQEAIDAGADIVGGDDLADKISKGEINFDRCIATPDMMGVVGKVGKILGPKGLMPNPKLGSVTLNVTDAVKAAKSGQIEFRVEKAGIIHAGIGKASFSEKAITENIRALVDAVTKAKPTGAKGTYLKKISISSTMGAGVKLDVSSIAA